MDIKTQRLALKPIGSDDLDALTRLLTDDTVKKTYMLPDFESREEVQAMAQRIARMSLEKDRYVAGIFLGAEFIGLLNKTEGDDTSLEVGYALLPQFYGCGYATEALTAAIGYFFSQGFQEVTAGAFEENLASIRVMVKSGMEKLSKQDTVVYRGKEHRCVYYGAKKV